MGLESFTSSDDMIVCTDCDAQELIKTDDTHEVIEYAVMMGAATMSADLMQEEAEHCLRPEIQLLRKAEWLESYPEWDSSCGTFLAVLRLDPAMHDDVMFDHEYPSWCTS